ncbi:hypothetical protein HMPREF3204_00140, partial [Gardnerella pickettii]
MWRFEIFRSERGVSLARSKRANVFAAQKQCFCFERLSESKCIRTLRFKRSCKSIRSAEGGDSPREQEKSRISVMKATKKFKHVRGLGDSW